MLAASTGNEMLVSSQKTMAIESGIPGSRPNAPALEPTTKTSRRNGFQKEYVGPGS